MYNIIIYLYLCGVAIMSLFDKKVKKMWDGERRAISDLKAKLDPQAKYIWVHAASLGEFEQGRPIMEHIRHDYPQYKILLTFFSPSGYEVRKDYEGADIVTYLPLDTIRNARRFLRTIHPVCALFIKYEFWYNYLHILKHRGVPVYSVSSIFRPNQIFFRWYGRSYAKVLNCITHFFVQNEQSRDLLVSKLGLSNISVTGDTRFDRVLTISKQAKDIPLVEQFCKDHKVFVAGSSWILDEKIFIPYFSDKNWRLVIAPHVITDDHLIQIEKLLQTSGIQSFRYSAISNAGSLGTIDDSKPAAIIIDCFGLLSSIYRYADVTYVGGGFGVGIHNLPEAAVWSKPVIFGPNNSKFQEAQDLKVCGGGLEIKDSFTFKTIMDYFISDEKYLAQCSAAAGHYVSNHAGAASNILKHIM